jgi:hypothetical protein
MFSLARHLYRYHAVLLRARFDEHAGERDMMKAKQLLEQGEEELFLNRHPQPFKCKDFHPPTMLCSVGLNLMLKLANLFKCPRASFRKKSFKIFLFFS